MRIPFDAVGRFAFFLGRFLRAALRQPPPKGQTLHHAWSIGIRSLPILIIIGAFVGTNLSIQGYSAFKPIGGERMVGMFVALAGIRELAPIIAASMVASKVGTEIASQVAVMRIQEQIDALEVMAVDPLWYLITPRLLGILLVMPALTTISTFVMVLAAYLVAVYQLGLGSADFIEFARQGIAPFDLVWCNLKAVIFGVVICLVSCFNGFYTRPGPEGVGQATNSAVVTSAVVCVVLNYFISELAYG
jgi:phospholipid/cholesterol/gamma-HCH transport system permease protein